VAGVILLAAVQCALWLLAASLTWSFRYLMVGPSSAEAHVRTVVSLAEFAWLGANLVGLVAFSVRRRGVAVWLLAGLTACDLLASFTLGYRVASTNGSLDSADWWWLTADAAVTLVLIYLLASPQSRVKSVARP